MKKLCACLLLCFGILFCYSQKSVSKAKIITQDDKVLDVFIRNSAYEGTPQKFEYSITENGPFVEIKSEQIKRVALVGGPIYEKHFISTAVIYGDYHNRFEYDYKDKKNLLSGPMLIEKVVDAPIALFQYVDKFSFPHFFYKKPEDETVTLLVNKSYLNENGALHQDASYKNMIAFLLQQKGIKGERGNTAYLEYSLRDMSKVFEIINSGELAVHIKRKDKINFRFGLLAGFAMKDIRNVNGSFSTFPGLNGKAFGYSTSPAFGISMEFFPGKKVKNYTFSMDLLHQSYTSTTDTITQSYYRGTAHIDHKMIELQTLSKLFLTRSRVNPFVEGGLSFNYVYDSEMSAQYINTLYGTVGKSSYTTDGKSFNVGFVAGGGVRFNMFSFHARYGIDGQYSTASIFAKYNFGRTPK